MMTDHEQSSCFYHWREPRHWPRLRVGIVEAGARVVLAARNREKLEEVAEEIRGAGREAFVVDIDLASPESIKQLSPKRTPSSVSPKFSSTMRE